MPIELKIAANVPYGSWFKDKRQVEAETRYQQKPALSTAANNCD